MTQQESNPSHAHETEEQGGSKRVTRKISHKATSILEDLRFEVEKDVPMADSHQQLDENRAEGVRKFAVPILIGGGGGGWFVVLLLMYARELSNPLVGRLLFDFAIILLLGGAWLKLDETYPRKTLTVPIFVIIGIVALFVQTKYVKQSGMSALVTVGNKDGKIGDLILPQSPGVSGGLILYFHNNGPGIALRFNAGIPFFIHMTRTKTLKNGSIGEGGKQDATIGVDSDYAIDANLPADWVTSAVQPNNTLLHLLYGEYEYCDKAGQYTCKSFRLWVQGPPFNRVVDLGPATDCSMPPGGFSLPTPTAELEYLPPCGFSD